MDTRLPLVALFCCISSCSLRSESENVDDSSVGGPSDGGGLLNIGSGGAMGVGGSGGSSTGGISSGGVSASGGGDASGGAGSGGAATGGGSTADGCDPNWIFCDDFETAELGGAPFGTWSEAGNYGTWDVSVTADRAFSGEHAASFSVETTGRAFMKTREPFPIAGNNFYGRYMIYFENLPGDGVGVHWDVVSALGDPGDEGNYRWGGMWGHMMANYHPGDCWGNADDLIPETGKWQCIEWQFDGPNNALRVWLDGEQATIQTTGGGCVDGDGKRTWLPPDEFTELQIGWAHYQGQLQGNQVWIDDVVVDDQRIGCPEMP